MMIFRFQNCHTFYLIHLKRRGINKLEILSLNCEYRPNVRTLLLFVLGQLLKQLKSLYKMIQKCALRNLHFMMGICLKNPRMD